MDKTQTDQKKAKLSDSFGGTIEDNIPEDVEWIDDSFYIKKTRFGLHTSILKDPLGQHFITGLEYEDVLKVTRWHLKCLQEDTLDEYTRVCLLYTSPSPRDGLLSRMPSSA